MEKWENFANTFDSFESIHDSKSQTHGIDSSQLRLVCNEYTILFIVIFLCHSYENVLKWAVYLGEGGGLLDVGGGEVVPAPAVLTEHVGVQLRRVARQTALPHQELAQLGADCRKAPNPQRVCIHVFLWEERVR